MLLGILYRSDGILKWKDRPPQDYDTANYWSHAKYLPDYAVRRSAVVKSVSTYPLKEFPKGALRSMCLDYASQNNPQMLMPEYLPIMDYELLYSWWKRHYPATLKKDENPLVSVLSLVAQ